MKRILSIGFLSIFVFGSIQLNGQEQTCPELVYTCGRQESMQAVMEAIDADCHGVEIADICTGEYGVVN